MTTPLSCFVRVSQRYGHYTFAISVLQRSCSLNGPDLGQSLGRLEYAILEGLILIHHYTGSSVSKRPAGVPEEPFCAVSTMHSSRFGV